MGVLTLLQTTVTRPGTSRERYVSAAAIKQHPATNLTHEANPLNSLTDVLFLDVAWYRRLLTEHGRSTKLSSFPG
jgi:hypothetical protein